MLSAPAANLEQASPAVRLVSRILSAVTPGLGVFAVDAEPISRDPAEVEAYRKRPAEPSGQASGADHRRAGRGDQKFPERMGNRAAATRHARGR